MPKDTLDETLGVVDKLVIQDLCGDGRSTIAGPVGSHDPVMYGADELLEDVEKDYEYQRDNFYKLVDRGSVAIDGILELAKEGEHPRGYEVAGNLIKQVAEVTEKLGELQEKMKRLKEVPSNAPKNVTNALYVGSTAELQKLLKGKKNGQ